MTPLISHSVDIVIEVVDSFRGGSSLLELLSGIVGCLLIHFFDQLINIVGFFSFEPTVEEGKHDAGEREDTSDQNIKPTDRCSTREADGSHKAVENCLPERIVHEVEPDTSSLTIALDGDDGHRKDEDVKGQAESSECVEIIGGKHSERSLHNHETGQDELDDFGQTVDSVDTGALDFFSEGCGSALGWWCAGWRIVSWLLSRCLHNFSGNIFQKLN